MFENLQLLLRRRRDNGETNQQIADSCGVTQQHINRLLNGDAKLIDGIHLDTAYRLFPFLFRDTAALVPPYLTPRESRLLEAYRLADENQRQILEGTAEIILAGKKGRGSSRRAADD